MKWTGKVQVHTNGMVGIVIYNFVLIKQLTSLISKIIQKSVFVGRAFLDK